METASCSPCRFLYRKGEQQLIFLYPTTYVGFQAESSKSGLVPPIDSTYGFHGTHFRSF